MSGAIRRLKGMPTDQRDKAVHVFKDIRTLRRMFKALSSDVADWKRNKGYSLTNELDTLRSRYDQLKTTQRNRDGDPLRFPKNFVKKTEQNIKTNLSSLVAARKFNETIKIGKDRKGTATYIKATGYGRKPTVELRVGYAWYRSVWQKLYEGERNLTLDYIILSATEYRTNVQHVRLYEVSAYGITEKETVHGWVGQSKLGKQHCAFRVDRKLAINAGQKLALNTINESLKGETNG